MTIKERVKTNIEFMKKQVGNGFGIYVITCDNKGQDISFVVPMELNEKNRQDGMTKEIMILKIFAKALLDKKIPDLDKKIPDQELKVESIICMSEAWTITRSKEQGWNGVMPSECDDKKEIVMCSGMDIDGNKSFISFEIKSQRMDGVIVKALATEPMMEYHSVDGTGKMEGTNIPAIPLVASELPVFDEFFKTYKNAT